MYSKHSKTGLWGILIIVCGLLLLACHEKSTGNSSDKTVQQGEQTSSLFQELTGKIDGLLKDGDLVLIKGSRANKMEDIIDKI